jgi:hypothetical protein
VACVCNGNELDWQTCTPVCLSHPHGLIEGDQIVGDVAIGYSQYLYETEVDGKRSLTSGRVTEIFVLRHGKWTNPGWHTDTEK